MRVLPRMFALLGASALVFGGAACGDDDESPPDAMVQAPDAALPDAAPPDAEVPDAAPPDAMPPMTTRSGTILVAEARIAGAALLGTGAAVDITYTDVSTVKAPVFDNRPAGSPVGCQVTVYNLDAGDTFPTRVGEGAVTITGTQSLIPPCSFDTGAGRYICPAAGGAVAAGDTITPNGDGTATVTLAGATPFGNAHVGMHLNLAGGFASAGLFPIVALGAMSNQVIVFHPTLAAVDTAAGAGGFAVLAGAGPTPASVPFLNNGSDPVMFTVAKEASAMVEAFSTMIMAGGVIGDGSFFVPSTTTTAALTAFPLDSATPVELGCSGAGGTCGSGVGIVISGETTNADLTGAGPFDMPEATTGQIATFSCTGFGTSVMFPPGAFDAIQNTNPTRIQVQVAQMGLAQVGNADMTNGTNIVAGRAWVGFTTVQP